MRRRTFLATSVFAVISRLSGCLESYSGESQDDSSPRLSRVSISNYDDKEHDIDIFVSKNGSIVYWDTHSLPGKEDDSIPGTNIDSESVNGDSADWVIGARLDGRAKGTQLRLADLKGSDNCYQITVRIEENTEIQFENANLDKGCEGSA